MLNPYTLTFGKEPAQYISRPGDREQILEDFLSERPSQQVYVIMGVRGSGKTVFMTELAKKIREYGEWIVVDLNPNQPDLLNQAAAYLSSVNEFASIFQKAKLNFSLFGFGLEVDGTVPIADIQVALQRMIRQLGKHGKRILFTIDEVTGSSQMKIFAFAFQQMLREDLPVYMLMTGLYQNVSDLENQDSLTFLYRAPKIVLSPLNRGAMASNYQENIGIPSDQALEMAKMTRGYSYAFQVLGYLLWQADGNYANLVPTFRQYLEERSYEKIWSELSEKDRKIAAAVAHTKSGSREEIRQYLGIRDNELNPYRKRLIRKGILDGSRRGFLTFVLPFFREFILDNT